jgi:hypothetical protein
MSRFEINDINSLKGRKEINVCSTFKPGKYGQAYPQAIHPSEFD